MRLKSDVCAGNDGNGRDTCAEGIAARGIIHLGI